MGVSLAPEDIWKYLETVDYHSKGCSTGIWWVEVYNTQDSLHIKELFCQKCQWC